MPRIADELSALEVKRLIHPGGRGNATFSVGGVTGLQMQITPNGAKSWLLRVTVGGRRRKIGLGSYPTVPLAAARERARDALDKIAAGVDPVEERRAAQAALRAAQARSLTFAEAMERFAPKKLAEFKSEKQCRLWRNSLQIHAVPILGSIPVDQITRADVLRVLEPIWTEKTETATKLRGRIEGILTWAEVAGHCEGPNPARWQANLDQFLPKPSKVRKEAHYPALALADAPRWWADLRGRDGMGTSALQFVVLTAARSGEVRGAVWSEIDLGAGLWTIPGERMKMGRTHRVPLSAEAVAVLHDLPRMQGSDQLFPAARGGMLSDMALSATMRRMQDTEKKGGRPGYCDAMNGRPATVHGLRSTFRQWTAERGFDRDMAEMQLAHAVGSDVERAYMRSDMLDRRRAMMAAWAGFLAGNEAGQVMPIRGASA
ncbi:tyrosine-type recombinase/integrase [Tateyamaria pelophila]|uniref:tyrosine-type recombinase/integrase n=1 Tax=Tateyamaria pelophila TaxID=328415 RepID=UPI001CBC811C|nr:site-specific integrase [Tateyamaria pelophila]